MGSAKEIQKRMQELQDSEEVRSTFSKLVSGGKENYETIIEKNKEEEKCPQCGNVLEGTEKFCPECGEDLRDDSEDTNSEDSMENKDNENGNSDKNSDNKNSNAQPGNNSGPNQNDSPGLGALT